MQANNIIYFWLNFSLVVTRKWNSNITINRAKQLNLFYTKIVVRQQTIKVLEKANKQGYQITTIQIRKILV